MKPDDVDALLEASKANASRRVPNEPVSPYTVLSETNNKGSSSRWQWEETTVKDASGQLWSGYREMDDDWEYSYGEWQWKPVTEH